MTDKVNLNTVSTFVNDTTAVSVFNNNVSAITSGFDNTLSLTPVAGTNNSMNGNLDMNSNQILNLPSPASMNSPARLVDVASNPTISVPPVGTSGATVPLLNANNTWTASTTQTFGNELVSGLLTVNGSTTLNSTLSVVGNSIYTGSISPSQTNGIVGTTAANNANAGCIGEYIVQTVASTTTGLSSGTAATVTAISLTAGDWDLSALVLFNGGGTTQVAYVGGCISFTTNAFDTTRGYYMPFSGTPAIFGISAPFGINISQIRASIAVTTTVYMVAQASFGISTMGAFGTLSARRVR